MTSATKKVIFGILKIVFTIAAILLLWWLFAIWTDNDLVLPQPYEVFKITFRLLGEGSTYVALCRSLFRAIIAFGISFVIAALLCIISRLLIVTKPFVDGMITFLRSVPTISVILLAMIAFNSGTVPIFVAVLVVAPIIYSAFCRETEADGRVFDVCRVFEVSRIKRLRFVILPQMRRAILPQIRDTFLFCIKIVIAGEVLALPRLGLGRQLYAAKVNLETSRVLALTLLVLVSCYIISGICSVVERRSKK